MYFFTSTKNCKFALNKANAEFKDGLLKITIPFAKGSELKTLAIK